MATITASKANEYYDALIKRDSSYVGTFFVGVKTTSVFCIATCRARKPKRENVEFFNSFKEAMQHGFRPCKICCPTENAYQTPPEIESAIQLVKENPKEKITDYRLRSEDINPEQVRRWFKRHYGLTFHAFQRMYRINNAYRELKDGKRTTDTAYDHGYESLSGFGYTFKKILGDSPNNSKAKNVILINRLTTPLGPMFVGATDNGISLLEFTDRKMLETEFKDLQRLLKAKILIGENEHIIQAKKEIDEYFKGELRQFTVSLDTPGTSFQQSAWKALMGVQYGTTSTYLLQAKKINNPKAVRAVARANGMNRVSIIIPCHRIIGSDGSLTGYGGGLERKRWLIDFEKENI